MPTQPRNSIPSRVRSLHQALCLAGLESQTVPRVDIEKLICEKYLIGIDGARRYIDTGRVMGLWECLDARAPEQVHQLPYRAPARASLHILPRVAPSDLAGVDA